MKEQYMTTIFGRRAWRSLALALMLAFVLAPAVAMAQPLTGTFVGADLGRQVAFSHNGKSLNDWAGVLKFKIDNGPEVSVFCVQLSVRVRAGNRYRSDGPATALPNGCQIRYLLDKYPASTAGDADEAAARQLAIWVFSDGLDPATIEDAKLRDRATALAAEAQNKPCPIKGTDAPEVTITPPTASAAVGQVATYTVQAGAGNAGKVLTVKVDGSAVLSDAGGANSGQQQTTVTLDGQGAATIWVLSTGAGQSNISAALPYELDSGTVFSQIDDAHPSQRLVMADRQSLTASASAQGAWVGSAPSPTEQSSATPTPAPDVTATPAPAPDVTATPTPASSQPAATPTRRPRRSTPTAQPTTTGAVISRGITATPAGAPADTTVTSEAAVPIVTPDSAGVEGATATTAPTMIQIDSEQSASAPRVVRPRSLPRTGEASAPALGPIVLLVLALLVGGWLLRRRGLRDG